MENYSVLPQAGCWKSQCYGRTGRMFLYIKAILLHICTSEKMSKLWKCFHTPVLSFESFLFFFPSSTLLYFFRKSFHSSTQCNQLWSSSPHQIISILENFRQSTVLVLLLNGETRAVLRFPEVKKNQFGEVNDCILGNQRKRSKKNPVFSTEQSICLPLSPAIPCCSLPPLAI